MGKALIIAEKPSVAGDIAKALGGFKKMADYYESDKGGTPANSIPIGIGCNCLIEDAIIDKNARIGDGVVITPHDKDENSEGPGYYIRDGIVVIPKNGVIPAGTRI